MLQRIASSLLLLSCLVTPALAATPKQPTGYGKARFGMTPAEVEKLYKGQVRVLAQENMGATPVTGPNIVRQLLANQRVPGLKEPTNVELRYWKDKLWVVIVYYGQNGNDAVNEALRAEYGAPTISAQDSVWQGPKTLVNTSNRERWYAMSDVALSRDAQQAFMEDMRKLQEKQRAQDAPPAAPQAAPH